MLKCIDEKRKTLEMVEGDFGLTYGIKLRPDDQESITSADSFSIKIFKEINGELLVEKLYSNIQNNIIEFQLSLEDSLKLPIGEYYYDLDWLQGQNLLQNLIRQAKFLVKEKAGVVDGS